MLFRLAPALRVFCPGVRRLMPSGGEEPKNAGKSYRYIKVHKPGFVYNRVLFSYCRSRQNANPSDTDQPSAVPQAENQSCVQLPFAKIARSPPIRRLTRIPSRRRVKSSVRYR